MPFIYCGTYPSVRMHHYWCASMSAAGPRNLLTASMLPVLELIVASFSSFTRRSWTNSITSQRIRFTAAEHYPISNGLKIRTLFLCDPIRTELQPSRAAPREDYKRMYCQCYAGPSTSLTISFLSRWARRMLWTVIAI